MRILTDASKRLGIKFSSVLKITGLSSLFQRDGYEDASMLYLL